MMIVTGPVMSPAVVGRYPWYPKLFGGRQAARSIHFLGHGRVRRVRRHARVAGLPGAPRPQPRPHDDGQEYDPALVGQAVTRPIIGVVLVVAIWIAASYGSLIDLRKSQRVLYGLQTPIKSSS